MSDLFICLYLIDSLLEFEDELLLKAGEHFMCWFEDLASFRVDLKTVIDYYDREK